jgi:hypothetical protein
MAVPERKKRKKDKEELTKRKPTLAILKGNCKPTGSLVINLMQMSIYLKNKHS